MFYSMLFIGSFASSYLLLHLTLVFAFVVVLVPLLLMGDNRDSQG